MTPPYLETHKFVDIMSSLVEDVALLAESQHRGSSAWFLELKMRPLAGGVNVDAWIVDREHFETEENCRLRPNEVRLIAQGYRDKKIKAREHAPYCYWLKRPGAQESKE